VLGDARLLRKPFAVAELVAAVTQILGRRTDDTSTRSAERGPA
jgi:DNA-binding response OmpR family regulator